MSVDWIPTGATLSIPAKSMGNRGLFPSNKVPGCLMLQTYIGSESPPKKFCSRCKNRFHVDLRSEADVQGLGIEDQVRLFFGEEGIKRERLLHAGDAGEDPKSRPQPARDAHRDQDRAFAQRQTDVKPGTCRPISNIMKGEPRRENGDNRCPHSPHSD